MHADELDEMSVSSLCIGFLRKKLQCCNELRLWEVRKSDMRRFAWKLKIESSVMQHRSPIPIFQ
jgi:hypothetical protein